MTVYVDDIVFSSKNHISGVMQKRIRDIIAKHRYKSNKKKCKYYSENSNKRITGGIITKDKKIVPQNKLLKKSHDGSQEIKKGKFDNSQAHKLHGVLSAIQMTDKKMPNLTRELHQRLRP